MRCLFVFCLIYLNVVCQFSQDEIERDIQKKINSSNISFDQSHPPIIFHFGHIVGAAENNNLVKQETINSYGLKNIQINTLVRSRLFWGINCFLLFGYLLSQFNQICESAFGQNSWIALLENNYAPLQKEDILNVQIIESVCKDAYIGYTEIGYLRKALKDAQVQLENFKKFCMFYRFLRWTGIGILNSLYERLYKKKNNYEIFVESVIRVIASILVSRYPSKQAFYTIA